MSRRGLAAAVPLGVIGAVYVATLFAPAPAWIYWLHQVVPVAVPVAAAIACLRTSRQASPRARTSWKLFAAGALAWAAGDSAYTILDMLGRDPSASATVADAGYLALIPLWAGALVLHPARSRTGSEMAGSVIDALTVVAASSALTIALVLVPILREAAGTSGLAVNLAYPVGDLALITAVVTLFVRLGRRPPPAEALIGAAVLVFAAGDIVYLRLAWTGVYEPGSPVDLTWIAGFVMLAVASGRGLAPDAAARPLGRVFPVLSILGFAGISGLAVAAGLSREKTILLLGAAGVGLLVVVRQALFLMENGRLIGALATAVDDLEQAGRAKERFIAGVSHDLRSPLTAVKGFAFRLRRPDGLTPDVIADVGQTIERNADRLKRMVEDLLCAATYAAGAEPHVAAEPVELRELTENTIRELGWSGRVCLEGNPAVATGDPMRIQQVLVNLVDNALKHGGPAVSVTVAIRPTGCGAEIVVTDDGPGIAVETLGSIFEPFVHHNGTNASTGLGLAIVRKLCEAMGGSVEVRSEPGRGSTFTVVLPASEVPPFEIGSPLGETVG